MLLRNKQKLQFSILVFCNGRWTTHTNLTDKDLAIKRAREMAKTDRSAEAIRVMQYQNNIRGGRIETELLHIDRPEAHQSQAYQVGFVEAVDVCNSIDDFFKLDARRATEALLRPYLGAQSLTATEFLHISGYQREIDRYGTLIESGIYRVARLQGPKLGMEIKERQEALFEYAETIQKNARTFAKSRDKLPKLEEQDFVKVQWALDGKVEPDQIDFYLTAIVCQHLTTYRAMMDKLEEVVLKLAATNDKGMAILDRIFADAIFSPGVLRDLVGPQVSLLAQVELTIEIMTGQYRGKTPFGGQCLALVSELMSHGKCPETAAAFRYHLIRSLASDTPFDRRENEPRLELGKLEQIALQLKTMVILQPDMPAIHEAIERRRRRLHNDM